MIDDNPRNGKINILKNDDNKLRGTRNEKKLC